MIKKSQYVQLTLLILLVFVLFLLTATSISFQNDVVITKADVPELTQAVVVEAEQESENAEIVIIEGSNTLNANNIALQLDSLKKNYQRYRNIRQVPDLVKKNMKQLILCSNRTEGYYTYEDILTVSKQGTDIIFATLPVKEDLTQEWKDLLGIRYIGERYTQKGISVFDGFMTGGIRWYEDYRIRTVRVKTNSDCKTYIAGINDEILQGRVRNEDATDIVWRKIINNSRLFVINGAFFAENTYNGVLSSVLFKSTSDCIYPIVNAKMLLIEDAPYLSDENTKEVEKLYARTAYRFLEEIAIPAIVSLSMSLEIQPQFYGTQYFKDSSKGFDPHSVQFLNKELIKIGGDIQVSVYNNQVNKMIRSIGVIESITEKQVTSLLFGNYKPKIEQQVMSALSYTGNITSIVHRWKDVPQISIRDEYAYIPMMTQGYEFDDDMLFSFDGAASSLGLITHGITMENMIYPLSSEDDWSTAFRDFSAYYYSTCQKYSYLDGVDGAGLEQRIRQYLIMKPKISYEQEKIHLEIENLYTQGYFILQTDKKIEGMSSGSYKKIGNGEYLITIIQENTDILLKENNG